MSTVIKLIDEPIVIATIRLPLHDDPQQIELVNVQVDAVAGEVGAPLYCILNLGGAADIDFSDIYLWLGEQLHNRPGSLTDPRVCTLMLGRDPMVAVWARKAYQRTGLTIPVFTTLADAVACARTRQYLAATS
ncbi:MAG: hypothetical protein GX573_16490 [Chloroflexi bacterium]|nr:hypothetical protein [Chloroflexota bacterium]